MEAQTVEIDREAVKAHAIVHGVRDAARAFGLSEDRVRQWSSRGGWLKDAGKAVVVQPLPTTMQDRVVTSVTKPGDAALTAMQRKDRRSKLHLANYVLNGSKAAAKLKGTAALQASQQVKGVADVGAKVFGWGSDTQGGQTLIAINLNGYVPPPAE